MDINDIKGNAQKGRVFAEESLKNGDVVIAIDLDYTLAHYKDEMNELFGITSKLGISEAVVRQAIASATEMNFSFGLLYRILSTKVHIFITEDKFVELLMVWFRKNYVLYDDAHNFLSRYLEHVPVIIVTAGDEEFQREKIELLGFLPDEIVVVPMGKPKLDALKDIFERYRKLVVFVDDNPGEFAAISLDAWFGFPATSYRVLMRRSDGPYACNRRNLLHSVSVVSSFDSLSKIILLEKETV